MSEIKRFSKNLIKFGKLLYDKGLIEGNEGNISCRLTSDQFVITPSGYRKADISEDQLSVIDLEGHIISGGVSPSSETHMHKYIYKKRPGINAIVHTHPPFCTAFAVAGISIDKKILPEAEIWLGKIPLIDYSAAGTDEMGLKMEPYIYEANVFLHRNHGLTTLGTNLDEAVLRTEIAEKLARTIYYATQMGALNELPTDELNRLEGLRRKLKK